MVVSKERIQTPGKEFYLRLDTIVRNGVHTKMGGGHCGVDHMPCYVVEFIWHVIFGEQDLLPGRAVDDRLHQYLRWEGGRQTMLPSPLKLTPYMSRFGNRPV